MTDAFDIGFREGLEACVVVALMVALSPTPWTRRQRLDFAGWIAGAIVVSVVVSVVIYDAAGAVTDDVVAWIELVATAVAVVMLTATALWTARYARDAAGGVTTRVAAIVAALSVGRETIEAACFVLEGHEESAATQVTALVTGAVLAACIAALVFGVVLARAGRRVSCIVAQALLVLVAAGMTMSLVRSAGHVGWIADERPAWIEIPQLADPSYRVVRAAVAAFGLRAELSAAECLVWVAFMAAVGAVMIRRWGVAPRSLPDPAPRQDLR